ncbi:MAG: hypothetical protein ABIP48_23335, partial [Planctomycetota bacterium]
ATGQAPVSFQKIFVAAAIAVVVALVLLALCSGVLGPALGDATDLRNGEEGQITTVGPAVPAEKGHHIPPPAGTAGPTRYGPLP